jgi:hypothetical protein
VLNFKHLILALLFMAVPVGLSSAAVGTQVVDGYLEPAGYTQLTSLAAAAGLGTIPSQARIVLIQAETQPIRWRDDGTNPTTTVGMLLAVGETLVYNGRLSSIKLIETAASAKANISFYK